MLDLLVDEKLQLLAIWQHVADQKLQSQKNDITEPAHIQMSTL